VLPLCRGGGISRSSHRLCLCSWGVEWSRCVRLTTLRPSVSRLSGQCGVLNISQPCRPPQPVSRDSFRKSRYTAQELAYCVLILALRYERYESTISVVCNAEHSHCQFWQSLNSATDGMHRQQRGLTCRSLCLE
jgi:hypothetical protein